MNKIRINYYIKIALNTKNEQIILVRDYGNSLKGNDLVDEVNYKRLISKINLKIPRAQTMRESGKFSSGKTTESAKACSGKCVCCFPLSQLSQWIIPLTTEFFLLFFTLGNFSSLQRKPMTLTRHILDTMHMSSILISEVRLHSYSA